MDDGLTSEEETFLRASTGAWLLYGLVLGDKLGILKALPSTAAEAVCVAVLAEKSKVDRRYLVEWLDIVADVVKHVSCPGCERVWMSSRWHAVLTREGGKRHLMELGSVFSRAVHMENMLICSMRSGFGFQMDCDDGFCASIERAQRPFLTHGFLQAVESVLPVKQKLEERGTRVADIGCGTCTALRSLASRFPLPAFFGFDVSEKVLKLARDLNASCGADVQTSAIDCAMEFPPRELWGSFDLVITTDALHDMSDPVAMLRAVAKLLNPQGVYFLCEPNHELAKHWSAPMHYGISLAACLPSASCCPPRAGIGQLGLTLELLAGLAREAGFAVLPQSQVDNFFHSFFVLVKVPFPRL